MKIVCIGAGYVGSVTAAALAALGYKTTVVDMDRMKVEQIALGNSPIYEPGLGQLIKMTAGRTLFSSMSYEAVREADAVFICVGTPSAPGGSADLTYYRQAVSSIARHLDPARLTVIVNKSTVPVGTAGLAVSLLEDEGWEAGRQVSVVSNPEFLREGLAVEDVFHPERIVVGVSDRRSGEIMRDLYLPFIERRYPEALQAFLKDHYPRNKTRSAYMETDPRSAELIKYASNAFLAVKISYINEIAQVCEALGANVREVARGMGLDSRIGSRFLQVSSGWSGSCFPKDTSELLATSAKYGCELTVVRAAVEANQAMHRYVVAKIRRRLRSLYGKTVGILGLTFKPDTDDARITQAASIIRQLAELGADIKAHDPQGIPMFRRVNPDLPVRYCTSLEETADRSDALVLLTHWQEYIEPDWEQIRSRMRGSYLLDTRNVWDAGQLREMGFQYEGIGLGDSSE